ncbi:uncharacterized protein LOC119195033 [Pungitius pungitius]|uniref:uncharacterized protein LOC119195033 n=1 Tax=Pungitius pungitius TaxID=134920 RepID=UPI002E0D415C
MERPAQLPSVPEVIGILDIDGGGLPISNSSPEGEEGKVEIAVVCDGQVELGVVGEAEGKLLPLLFSGVEEEEDEEEDVGSDCESEDSGFQSEEDEEDGEDDPPTQRRTPLSCWMDFEEALPPLPCPAGRPLSILEEEALLPVPQKFQEDCVEVSVKRTGGDDHEDLPPSTSGLGPSTKRTREEDYMEVSVKRQRTGGDDHEDLPPSTSGLGPSTLWTREEDCVEVSVKRTEKRTVWR